MWDGVLLDSGWIVVLNRPKFWLRDLASSDARQYSFFVETDFTGG